jgi:hypothetical protein
MNLSTTLRHFLKHACWHPAFYISQQQLKQRAE